MPEKSNRIEFIEKATKVHGNRYDYSNVVYHNSATKVIILCPIHGKFEVTPNNHLRGRRCIDCQGLRKMTTEIFIERANKTHENRYDYSKVNYVNSKENVIIICKYHGEFKQAPNQHLIGNNCVKCVNKNKSYTTEYFIKKAKIVHGDRYDYSLVKYINSDTKVDIICKEHGIFKQKPSSHCNHKQNCPKCIGKIDNIADFVKKANKKYNGIYDYSLVDYDKLKKDQKIDIYCPRHGQFKQKPSSHIHGFGCSKCGYNTLTNIEFIKLANDKHGNLYDYSLCEYVNLKTKINVICKHHGVFNIKAKNHLYCLNGCPTCLNSKGEKNIRKYLIDNKITFIPQKKFNNCRHIKPLPFDFYLPDYNICIEYDGRQHLMPVEHFGGKNGYDQIIKRDNIKNDFCLKNNIKLIRISYKENIFEILDKKLNDK